MLRHFQLAMPIGQLKLVTLDLGGVAGLIGQRMAAGSLFTGKFQLDIANPLNSTKFGIPFICQAQKILCKICL